MGLPVLMGERRVDIYPLFVLALLFCKLEHRLLHPDNPRYSAGVVCHGNVASFAKQRLRDLRTWPRGVHAVLARCNNDGYPAMPYMQIIDQSLEGVFRKLLPRQWRTRLVAGQQDHFARSWRRLGRPEKPGHGSGSLPPSPGGNKSWGSGDPIRATHGAWGQLLHVLSGMLVRELRGRCY